MTTARRGTWFSTWSAYACKQRRNILQPSQASGRLAQGIQPRTRGKVCLLVARTNGGEQFNESLFHKNTCHLRIWFLKKPGRQQAASGLPFLHTKRELINDTHADCAVYGV